MDKLITKYSKDEDKNVANVKSEKLFKHLSEKYNVKAQYFQWATVHMRHPSEQYISKFFEIAVVGDSLIQLMVNRMVFEMNKNKGQMNDLLKQFASNKFNAEQFERLAKKMELTDFQIIESYEIEVSKSKISGKIKETCFEGLIGAIFLSNVTASWEELTNLYNKFIAFLNE